MSEHVPDGIVYGGYTSYCSCGAFFNRYTKGEAKEAMRDHLADPTFGAIKESVPA